MMVHKRSGVSRSLAGLIFIIGLYLMGVGYFLGAAETTELIPILYWNRVYFYMVLGGLLIGVYTWMNFKPRGLSTKQYTYNPWNKEDIPDSQYGTLTWGSGRFVNKSSLKEGEEPSEPTREYGKRKEKSTGR